MRYNPKPIDVNALLVAADRTDADIWQRLTGEKMIVHRFDCQHNQLLGEPHITSMAAIINDALAEAILHDTDALCCLAVNG